MALDSSVGKSECWNASREQGTHMFLKSSHRGFRALHRGRAAGSLLHCNRIVGETQNELDRYMWFNHILQYYQADMSYTIYMVCSRFCTITKQNVFFSMLKRLGIRNLEKTEEWVGRQHYCWPEKKLCCMLGNGFKSLFISSDCKVNMERVQNSIQVWTDQNSSFPSAEVVKGHKHLLGGEEQVSNSQNTCSRPDF